MKNNTKGNIHDIDSFYRDFFKGKELEPSQQVWDKIVANPGLPVSASVETMVTKSIISTLTFKITISITLFSLAYLLYYLNLKNEQQVKATIIERKTIVTKEKTTSFSLSGDEENVAEMKPKENILSKKKVVNIPPIKSNNFDKSYVSEENALKESPLVESVNEDNKELITNEVNEKNESFFEKKLKSSKDSISNLFKPRQ